MRGNSNIAVLVFIGAPVYINIRYGALIVVCDAICAHCVIFFLGVMCVAGLVLDAVYCGVSCV